MFQKIAKIFKPGRTSEKGYAFIIVMVLMVIGSLIIIPLLSYMNTGQKSGRIYEENTNILYAADAGIEDAKWLIKNDQLDLLDEYAPYDFSDDGWSYTLPESVNGESVNVNIRNIWIPRGLECPADAEDAEELIEGTNGNMPKLVITSSVTQIYVDEDTPGIVEIKIQYYPEADDDLRITSLGAWLPYGFTYLEDEESNIDSYDSDEAPELSAWGSGTVILWEFDDWPFLGDTESGQAAFPANADGTPLDPNGASPLVSKITYSFTAQESGSSPQPMAWINTNTDLANGMQYTWDGDVRLYHLKSTSDDTTIETYLAQTQFRRLHGAIEGDYKAIGNSLMLDSNNDGYYRETFLTESSATADDIPDGAIMRAAYLYWTAWRNNNSVTTIYSDSCSNSSNWNSGSNWALSGGKWTSHYSSGEESTRYLTLKNDLDLSSYPSGSVMVYWDQSTAGTLEETDGLDFAFSSDGGTTWSSNLSAFTDDIGSTAEKFYYIIPDQYLSDNFRIRFMLVGCAEGTSSSSGGGHGGGGGSGSETAETVKVDNIYIKYMEADTACTFKVDGTTVSFDSDENPQTGGSLVSDKTQTVPNHPNGALEGFSYSCFKDVTDLVKAYSEKAPDPATNYPGNGTYTVGNVSGDTRDENNALHQLGHAGWSLIIIYTSPDTSGHQLYLYDQFTFADDNTDIDFDRDGNPGGDISGFIVPSRNQEEDGDWEENVANLTVFVGEGDESIEGDFIALQAPEEYWYDEDSEPANIPDSYKLYDNITCDSNTSDSPDNVWNSQSTVTSADGVDIDNFNISWDSDLLSQGDSAAHIDMYTVEDNWDLVYIILSFRSQVTTGGLLSYSIE